MDLSRDRRGQALARLEEARPAPRTAPSPSPHPRASRIRSWSSIDRHDHGDVGPRVVLAARPAGSGAASRPGRVRSAAPQRGQWVWVACQFARASAVAKIVASRSDRSAPDLAQRAPLVPSLAPPSRLALRRGRLRHREVCRAVTVLPQVEDQRGRVGLLGWSQRQGRLRRSRRPHPGLGPPGPCRRAPPGPGSRRRRAAGRRGPAPPVAPRDGPGPGGRARDSGEFRSGGPRLHPRRARTAYGDRVDRSPLFLAALASAAVPGLDPASVEALPGRRPTTTTTSRSCRTPSTGAGWCGCRAARPPRPRWSRPSGCWRCWRDDCRSACRRPRVSPR